MTGKAYEKRLKNKKIRRELRNSDVTKVSHGLSRHNWGDGIIASSMRNRWRDQEAV